MLLTTALLAERWSLTASTLAQWRCNGSGPPFVKIGGAVRYRLEDIEAYEAGHSVRSTAEGKR